MPNNTSENTQPTMTYPTKQQHAQWKQRAEELDMSLSEYVASMVEAGYKKFEAEIEPDLTNEELREQRNDLKRELEHARERMDELEERLYSTERAKVEEFVRDNPGTTYAQIVTELMDTAAERATDHLDDLEGESVRKEGDHFYPVEREHE